MVPFLPLRPNEMGFGDFLIIDMCQWKASKLFMFGLRPLHSLFQDQPDNLPIVAFLHEKLIKD